MSNNILTNSIFIDGISISAFIYYKIKIKYIGPSKYCSFPFANAAVTIAIIIITAIVRA